jgi:hypothetical protein
LVSVRSYEGLQELGESTVGPKGVAVNENNDLPADLLDADPQRIALARHGGPLPVHQRKLSAHGLKIVIAWSIDDDENLGRVLPHNP